MKTEQEQTKQMLKILCDKFQCSATDTSYMAKSCRQCEDIIEALHEAGYGDVSEYKAEIERLNSNNGFLQCVISHSKDIMDEAVKQAQIDVLDNVKDILANQKHECLEINDSSGYDAICECEKYVDLLFKEVENGEDKG